MGRYGEEGWQGGRAAGPQLGQGGNYRMDRDFGQSGSRGGFGGGSFGGGYEGQGSGRPFVGESSYGGLARQLGRRFRRLWQLGRLWRLSGFGSYGGSSGSGGSYGQQQGGRGFWDKASDEVSSWFGDDDARRRREQDEHRGRGPKGYTRSDERIREDVNDRLTDDGWLDASDIEVQVSSAEVTLTGQVNSREEKRRAEDIVEADLGREARAEQPARQGPERRAPARPRPRSSAPPAAERPARASPGAAIDGQQDRQVSVNSEAGERPVRSPAAFGEVGAMDTTTLNRQDCIDDCLRCYRVCFEMAMTHCLEHGGRHVEPGHFRIMMSVRRDLPHRRPLHAHAFGTRAAPVPGMRRDLRVSVPPTARSWATWKTAWSSAAAVPEAAGRWRASAGCRCFHRGGYPARQLVLGVGLVDDGRRRAARQPHLAIAGGKQHRHAARHQRLRHRIDPLAAHVHVEHGGIERLLPRQLEGVLDGGCGTHDLAPHFDQHVFDHDRDQGLVLHHQYALALQPAMLCPP